MLSVFFFKVVSQHYLVYICAKQRQTGHLLHTTMHCMMTGRMRYTTRITSQHSIVYLHTTIRQKHQKNIKVM